MESIPHPGRPRILDVARRAGVGAGTVSRVLNSDPRVTVSTRLQVMEAIEELGYRPSALAQRLRLGRTMTVGAVIPFVTNPWGERLRGVVSRLADTGYDLVLLDVETPEQRDRVFWAAAGRHHADGLITAVPPTEEAVRSLRHAGVPVVLLASRHPELSSVGVDDVQGGCLATQHLLDLGHRRIGFVGDPRENPFGFTSSALRRRGYEQTLRKSGIEPASELIAEGPHAIEVAAELTHRLLRLQVPPTAIFAHTDLQALGVLEAAREDGRAVPGDLSVIGFDDISIAAYAGLTTVRTPLQVSGERAADILLSLLADPTLEPTEEVLPLEIVTRATTGPPRR